MSSQQIQASLAPPDSKSSRERALKILDAQFHSLESLDGLEAALEHSRAVNEDLQSKFSLSQSRVDSLIEKTRSSARTRLHSAQELSLLRHSIADELSSLSDELVSSMSDGERKPTLLEDIETLHRSLKELQSVKSYVQIIEYSLKQSETATEQIRSSSQEVSSASVTEYVSLQEFVERVASTCSQVEDASGSQPLHLIQFLEGVRDKTWQDMKGVLSATLLAASEKLQWPMPVDYASATPEDRSAFEKAFLNLLKLQKIGERLHTSVETKEYSEKDGLYPLQTLVQPVSLRFKYHFEGSRQTNRLDKPEWYFTHVLDVVHEHKSFLDTAVQQILSSTEYRGFVAWREFTLLLLPLLARKLRRTIPSLLPHSSLLAHTIYQTLIFDAALVEEEFALFGTSAAKAYGTWDGVSNVILGKAEWFEAWLEGEKRFAEDQYNEIISSADAWLIADDDGTAEGLTDRGLRATNSARRVKALVEQVTDRYSPLPHFAQRTRFLISVQLPLLEHYHSRISASLDAFETLSSAFVRAVPGALSGLSAGGATTTEGGVRVDTRKLTRGVDGAQRLCKALVSARFMGAAMDAWGEELFFLELWTEINQRASLRARAEAISSLPDPRGIDSEGTQGTIFEELVLQYAQLAGRAEDMIIQQVCGEIEASLKAHYSAATKPDVQASEEIILPQSLLGPVALLSSHLSFLRSTLPQTTSTTLYRRIASRLADHILQRAILYRGRSRISLVEGRSVLAEAELWVETCQVVLGGSRHRIEVPWSKLLQAARLVGSEGEGLQKVVGATFGMLGDREWREVTNDVLGESDMGREEMGQILKLREDCN